MFSYITSLPGVTAKWVESSLLTKGTHVALHGWLIRHTYEDSGDIRYLTEIHMHEFLKIDQVKQPSED